MDFEGRLKTCRQYIHITYERVQLRKCERRRILFIKRHVLPNSFPENKWDSSGIFNL